MEVYEAGGVPMAVSYKKLFHMMIEKDMTNADLQKRAGFSANIITRLKRGGYISLESVENICRHGLRRRRYSGICAGI